MKILVGLSGGVDSAVTALLLRQAGHEIQGVTMSIWDSARPFAGPTRGACYGPEEADIESAREVCAHLGISLQIVDCRRAYDEAVLDDFRREYRRGRTPNPCVRCNPLVKFGALLSGAREAGLAFDRFATGHYARIESDAVRGRHALRKAADTRKDQTYFLYRLSQEQLAATLFPLGALTKEQVRDLARANGLAVHDKEESQDFYAGHYGDLLDLPNALGDIVDGQGRVLGRHEGLWHYTIGQRKGLGIASTRPLYVVALDAATNRVIVGEKTATLGREFVVADAAWMAVAALGEPLFVTVKIRSTHPETPGRIEPLEGGEVRVTLAEPQEAITPGQSAVFYDGDRVVGGGIIDRTL